MAMLLADLQYTYRNGINAVDTLVHRHKLGRPVYATVTVNPQIAPLSLAQDDGVATIFPQSEWHFEV